MKFLFLATALSLTLTSALPINAVCHALSCDDKFYEIGIPPPTRIGTTAEEKRSPSPSLLERAKGGCQTTGVCPWLVNFGAATGALGKRVAEGGCQTLGVCPWLVNFGAATGALGKRVAEGGCQTLGVCPWLVEFGAATGALGEEEKRDVVVVGEEKRQIPDEVFKQFENSPAVLEACVMPCGCNSAC